MQAEPDPDPDHRERSRDARGIRHRCAGRLGTEPEGLHTGPFVDREEERRIIVDAFLCAVQDRSIRLLTLVGEAGFGKTRLVRELFSFIDERLEVTYWREARCLPYGDILTFWPLAQIVKAHAGILESDPPEVWSEKLDAAVRPVPLPRADRDWVRARLGPLLGEGGREGAEPAHQGESFMAWRRFLEAVASVHPLVLVFEDVHWADDPVLDFLEYLVMGNAGSPMLVLCTGRPALFDRRPSWGRWVNGSLLRVGPLDDEHAQELFEPALGPEVITRLVERAGGNPLFAQEFARLTRDRAADSLAGAGGHATWPAIEPLPGDMVPDSITSIISARLDALPPGVKSVLQDASVIGKVFWSGALAAMGGMDEPAVLNALRELSKRELVSRSRSSRMRWNEEFVFSHVLVRDVVNAQIPRAARAVKHRAVAGWLDRVAGDQRDVQELLAYHYEQALELAQASGASVDEKLRDRFRTPLLAAGDRAMSLDVGRAAEHYGRALELMSPNDPGRPGALDGFADAAVQVGRFEEAEAAFLEAIDAFLATGSDAQAGDAMRKLSNLLWHQGDVTRSGSVLHDAIELLERLPPGRELVEACSETGWVSMLDGDLEAAVSWSERALEIAGREGLRDLRPRALALRGQARCHAGEFAGTDDIREGLELAIELGLSREAARCNEILAEELMATDGPRGAATTTRFGIALAEGRGVTYMAMAMRALSLLPALIIRGDWETALAEADAVVAWSNERGGRYFGTLALTHSAHARLWLGEEVLSGAEDAFLDEARRIGETQVLVPALAVAAILRHAAGRTEAADDLVSELASFDGDPGGWIRATYLPDLAAMCVRARPDVADALITSVTGPTRLAELARRTGRGHIDEAAGRLEAAASGYADAAAGWGAFGAPALRARCLLGEGRCLMGLGRADATGPLTGARDTAAALRARGVERDAVGLLEEMERSTSALS